MNERGDSQTRGTKDGPEPYETDGCEGTEDEANDLPGAGGEARRARWTAAVTGALLALAGLAAALQRFLGNAGGAVPFAYGAGAAVCALAGVLGFQGRTRRALWLLVAGVFAMAVGDQFD